MTNCLVFRIQMSETKIITMWRITTCQSFPHSQSTLLHIFIPSCQLTVSMHQIGSLICNQHNKLMAKMTILFLLCSSYSNCYVEQNKLPQHWEDWWWWNHEKKNQVVAGSVYCWSIHFSCPPNKRTCAMLLYFLLPEWPDNSENMSLYSLHSFTCLARNTKAWHMCCFLLLGGHMKNGWINSTQTLLLCIILIFWEYTCVVYDDIL